jgi:signal transduction histidine kinase
LLRTSHAAFLAAGSEYRPNPTVELDAVREDGSMVPVELSIAPLRTAQALLLRIAVRDISERHRLRTDADAVKDRFLATVSHELRTPLTSVLGYAEMLEDLGPEHVSAKARAFLEVITRNAQREIRLVDDLLTLVSAGEEGLSIRLARIDLYKVVLESVEGARPAALDAELRLSYSGDGNGAYVRGDADRLGQAVDNLISNAVKFSPPGAEVNVCLRREASNVIVTVADSGPGIAGKDVHRVFERHFRGQHAVESEAPGAGLGLTIVKSIIEAHQGTVEVESPPAGGTRVQASLPLAPSIVRSGAMRV